ncbi:hypothetical protein [Allokutzneria albata]|uniref:Lipoprotein n=1 Tax=Allokutzneria albata TaxID=211114 RepID=A0A1G9UIV3_ALLAB|nr:hypothetical protein [Allokutzneria albata]SDM59870.1 hypothetical protein SAMN04489726_2441 [Allokutzneria albata]
MKRTGLAFLALLCTAACAGGGDPGAGTPTGAEPAAERPATADVVVKETGQLGGYVYALVENREDREVRARVKFTGHTASGSTEELAKADHENNADYLAPGSTGPIITMGGGSTTFTRIEAVIEVLPDRSPKHGPGSFEARVTKIGGGSFSKEATVSIKNLYPEPVRSAVVGLLCKNSAGKPVAASSTQFSAAAGAVKDVRMSLSGQSALDVASCEAFPRIKSYTEFGN